MHNKLTENQLTNYSFKNKNPLQIKGESKKYIHQHKLSK